MDTKFCKDCGEYRPKTEFTKNARTRDGLAFYCRTHLAERSLRSREARRKKPRVNRRPPADLVVPDGNKWCPDCGEVFPLDNFVRTRQSKSGYSAYCKPCHNARGRASKDRVGGSRSYHLTHRYGMTAAEADFMLEQQDGLCAICRTAPAVHVDHDHDTGKVRALLCFNCNGGLGQFKDDPYLLHAAAYYVEFHTIRQQIVAERGDSSIPVVSARPYGPPVGSKRRPGVRGAGSHTGRTSRSRQQAQTEEADG